MKHTPVMVQRPASSRWSVYLIFISAAAIILGIPVSPPTISATERHIRVEASMYRFSPEQIFVSPGERVIIELVATDVKHGLYLDGYGLNLEAEPGQPARETFVATRPGVYRFRCSVSCGNLHPFMLGKLQVGPNLALLRGSLLGAVAILIALLPRFAPQTSRQKRLQNGTN